MSPWHFTQCVSKIGCTLPNHSAAASAPHAKRAKAKVNRKVKTALQYMCEEKPYAFGMHWANQILRCVQLAARFDSPFVAAAFQAASKSQLAAGRTCAAGAGIFSG